MREESRGRGVVFWGFFCRCCWFSPELPLKTNAEVQHIHKERVCVTQTVFLKVLTGISLNMQ